MKPWPAHLYRVPSSLGIGWDYIVAGMSDSAEREARLAESSAIAMRKWPPTEAETEAATALYAGWLRDRN